MTEMFKRVASVTADVLGDELASAQLTGATTIPLVNTGDFYEDGGSVLIDGTVYTYSAVEEGEDDDAPTPSITLDSGLTDDLPIGTPVEVWNPDTGAVVVDYLVGVTDDTDASPGVAYLRHNLIPLLPEGLPPGVGDSVTVVVDEFGDWIVTDVHGRKPGMDPAYIKTGVLEADVSITAGDRDGARVVMDAADGAPAFKAYDAANDQTVNIDGIENFMQGSIATDAAGQPRVEVGQGSTFGFPAEEVRFYTGDAGEDAPAEISASVTGGFGQLYIAAPEMSPNPPALYLISDPAGGSANNSATLNGVAVQLAADSLVLVDSNGITLDPNSNGPVSVVNGVLDATLGAGSIGTGTVRDSVRDDIGRAWTSYAGSITVNNVTLGNGTLTAHYLQNGKLVHFRIKITFGSTTALTGSPTFTLPAAATAARTVNGNVLMFDTSATSYNPGAAFNNTINVLQVRSGAAPLSATVPFTWATGDELVVTASYEAA